MLNQNKAKNNEPRASTAPTLKAVLEYVENGWPVFPLYER